jgi:hypothetical protein
VSDKPFDAEACSIGGQASATNGLADATNGLSDVKNALCNRPLNKLNISDCEYTNHFGEFESLFGSRVLFHICTLIYGRHRRLILLMNPPSRALISVV